MAGNLQMFLFLFKSKYRRKYYFRHLLLCVGVVYFFIIKVVYSTNCTSVQCMNGKCENGTSCVCYDGWQGQYCQSCGGKVRLTEKSGIIHDGHGNYSTDVKCSWLVDAGGAPNATIRLHLEEFATECGWDHLYIFDGDSVHSPLLAVFSGLMYKDGYSIRRIPEVVAHSGSALLHFFSDAAINMTGFNISYRLNSCPSRFSNVSCSGNGVCIDGVCTCDAYYLGDACDIPVCPNNCSNSHGVCNHEMHRCDCNDGYKGEDCSQVADLGYWEVVHWNDFVPEGSASHGAVVWRDSLYIVGGESYHRGKMIYVYDFNGNVWETPHLDSKIVPRMRYGHSAVLFGDKIYMYGGVEESGVVSNELWAFDVSAKTWENITVRTEQCNTTGSNASILCGPLRSAGHTATVVTGRLNKKSERMIVIFGHSPVYGYLNTVQEYQFGTRDWKVITTQGYPVKGGYGHSAAWDQLSQRIYVYGGFASESTSTSVLSSKLYSFDPSTHTWMMLMPAPSARFLHTATFFHDAGLMIVFGGNIHNDTAHSFGAKCYSSDMLVYDVICDSWSTLPVPQALRADLARFGHSANIFENSLYIYGGFDGQMLSDMLRYTPGNCSSFTDQSQCLSTRPGVKCVWNKQKPICEPISGLPHLVTMKVPELQDTQTAEDKMYRNHHQGAILCLAKTTIMVIYCARQYGRSQCYGGMSACCAGVRFTVEKGTCRSNPCPGENRSSITASIVMHTGLCSGFSDCNSCVHTSFQCVWCGTAGCSYQNCRGNILNNAAAAVGREVPNHLHGSQSGTEEQKCEANEGPVCHQLHSCQACSTHNSCHWDFEQRCKAVGNVTEQQEPVVCTTSCPEITSCLNCTVEECIWCQNEGRCVDKNAYTASFPYGQCREWTTHQTRCRSTSGKSACSFYPTCVDCRDDPACGWCDDGSGTGLGQCLPGGNAGPNQPSPSCATGRWFFTECPTCQCNGHSTCPTNSSVCNQPCANFTQGPHCEHCVLGYHGNAVNGGKCIPCECNDQGAECHPDTGKCYCTTKGITGDHCERCDTGNHYHGDPTNKGSCFYDLTIDYQFTFNLSKKEDRHYTQINFKNSPPKPDVDADFSITCSVMAKMNITIKTASSAEKPIVWNSSCTSYRTRFSKAEHTFGIEDNVTFTTFYVYVYDFRPPLWIQISFSQYPKLNLQQFFITFSTCFLLLLLVAAILWKIKQKYDMYRRRQRLFVEMEQMASRPFSQVLVEIELREKADLCSNANPATLRKRKKDSPSPIALEPCCGNRAAVLSLLVRLPTGGETFTPSGQSGLAVASALVTLGNPRKVSIDPTAKGDAKCKSRKSSSQHPENCI